MEYQYNYTGSLTPPALWRWPLSLQSPHFIRVPFFPRMCQDVNEWDDCLWQQQSRSIIVTYTQMLRVALHLFRLACYTALYFNPPRLFHWSQWKWNILLEVKVVSHSELFPIAAELEVRPIHEHHSVWNHPLNKSLYHREERVSA